MVVEGFEVAREDCEPRACGRRGGRTGCRRGDYCIVLESSLSYRRYCGRMYSECSPSKRWEEVSMYGSNGSITESHGWCESDNCIVSVGGVMLRDVISLIGKQAGYVPSIGKRIEVAVS